MRTSIGSFETILAIARIPSPSQMDELLRRARKGDVVVLDTRPAREYAAGHIAGAISVPIDDLQSRLRRSAEIQSHSLRTAADRTASTPIRLSSSCAPQGGVRDAWRPDSPSGNRLGLPVETGLPADVPN